MHLAAIVKSRRRFKKITAESDLGAEAGRVLPTLNDPKAADRVKKGTLLAHPQYHSKRVPTLMIHDIWYRWLTNI